MASGLFRSVANFAGRIPTARLPLHGLVRGHSSTAEPLFSIGKGNLFDKILFVAPLPLGLYSIYVYVKHMEKVKDLQATLDINEMQIKDMQKRVDLMERNSA